MAKDMHSITARLDILEKSWFPPTPETEKRCLEVLEKYDAMDVAPMLGLVNA